MGIWQRIFPVPSRERFAKKLIRALRARGESRTITYNPEGFCLVLEGAGRAVLNLGNAYHDFLAASYWQREAVLRQYAALAPPEDEEPVPFAQAKENLLPRVQSRFYHECFRMQCEASGFGVSDAIPTRPINEDLCVDVVQDWPESIQSIGRKTLEEWGVGFDEALALAKDNLWRRSNEEFASVGDGAWCSPWRDTHDASRLYLHDLVWQLQVRGEHVAMVPNRNVLLVCGSGDAEALVRVAQLAESVLQEPRPLSGLAVRLEGTRWVPFLPAEDSPAYWPLKKAAMRSLALDYAEQNRLLEEKCQRAAQDVFVAGYHVVQREDQTWHSWTSWVDGVTDALVPQAETIMFARVTEGGRSSSLGMAPWERVQQVAGALLEATDDYPARYRVRCFPSSTQLAAMQLRPLQGVAGN